MMPAIFVDHGNPLLSIPTPDHYLPFLYIPGLRRQSEPVSIPVEGIEGGSMSMRAVRFG